MNTLPDSTTSWRGPYSLERPPETLQVPVDACFVDGYGRPERKGRVAKLVKDFDPAALGTLMLSARSDGRYAIIDGQHRWKAAKEVGLSHVPGRVHYGLSYEREAQLYGLFANVAQQSSRDRFRARLEMQEESAVAIKAIIEKYGLAISWYTASVDGHIAALDACDRVYHQTSAGPVLLDTTIALIQQTWGNDHHAFSSPFILGIAAFLARYQNVYDRRRFIDRLSRITPQMLYAKSRAITESMSSSSNTLVVGQAAMYVYNVGLRKRLPEWKGKLYADSDSPEYHESRKRALASANEAKAMKRAAS